jgi:hypothetical protein
MSQAFPLKWFSPNEIGIVNEAAAMAEELVSNAYKMSASQWLRRKYDFKTMAELGPGEIVHGPFAQIIRYEGQRPDSSLGSDAYDFYKICLQDHAILDALRQNLHLRLLPFCLYILTHELIHIVRFSKFLCSFVATDMERLTEESIVHRKTHAILSSISVLGLPEVFSYYRQWREPVEEVSDF